MSDKAAAEAQLRDAAARFVAECARASDEEWRVPPAPRQWSMADVCEHVAISTRNIGRMLEKQLLANPLAGRATGVIDAEIPYLFHRGDEPPGVAAPTGSFPDRRAAVQAVDAGARSILAWSAGATGDLRAVGVAHPVFGLLDGVQWLLFAAAHVERHRAQLIGLIGSFGRRAPAREARMVTHRGGCHCGRVRFEVDAPAELEVDECNCSICGRTGFLHLIVPQSRFRLVSGRESLTSYRFNTGVAEHLFCSACGIKAFYVPRSHPNGYSVNARCLDEGTVVRCTVSSFDGANWEQHATELKPLAE